MISPDVLLSRIRLHIPLVSLANRLAEAFTLGHVVSFEPLPVGYEEVNALLITSTGKYIVKIFSKDKKIAAIQSNVRALLAYHAGGIPVPQLFPFASNTYLYKISEEADTYLVVMEYFDGKRFTDISPTFKDKKLIVDIMANIHELRFQTNTQYDAWLTINLQKEFAEKSAYLTDKQLQVIKPVVDRFSHLRFAEFQKTTTHLDLHRENVMKNESGRYCILDLASTDLNYTIVDIATYFALFCTEFTQSAQENIYMYRELLARYKKHRIISQYESQQLMTLIQATFASNVLIPAYLIASHTDENPAQTLYYRSMGEQGLELFKGIQSI